MKLLSRKKNREILFFLYLVFAGSIMLHGQRYAITINNDWQFYKGDMSLEAAQQHSADWEKIRIPHTWNQNDVTDEMPGYYRGPGWYKKKLYLEPSLAEKNLYLLFGAANQVADVYINGAHAGKHIGGYTRFTIDITPYTRFTSADEKSPQDILVRVSNRHNEDIPPLSADFTFYGGIYRDIQLVALQEIHFSPGETGSDGVFISTPDVSRVSAKTTVKGHVTNKGTKNRSVTVSSVIYDQAGKLAGKTKSDLEIKPNANAEFRQTIDEIKNPNLWSTDHPYLYRVVTSIIDQRTGKKLDELINPLGFRYFEFDPENGFSLNGEHLKLIGVNRHQDFQGYGNAIPDAVNEKDVYMMKEMGANFLRIAHYPQDKKILRLCDRLGILTSVEIPIVNRITESDEFTKNSLHMQREMIHQNFNHPSIIMWTYMNEVLLRPRYKDDPGRYEEYVKNISKLAEEIEKLTRSEDPYRYTMIPNHGAFQRYVDAGLTEIPMLVGWNLYQGWYDHNINGFGGFLDRHRELLPHKPLLVTEYGGGADPRIRCFEPTRFDFSVEYNNFLHHTYLQEMLKRPFVAAAMVWNFADFNSEGRVDAVPNMNNKGLSSWDRVPKDTYYLYKALLSKEPYVAIASRNWYLRSGIEDHDGANICTQPVVIYSTMDSVSLSINNEKCDFISATGTVKKFTAGFRNGMNKLQAIGYQNETVVTDFYETDFRLQPLKINDDRFSSIDISIGDNRMIIDEVTGVCWLPDQAYTPGSWGYVDGSVYRMKSNARQGYGSDIPIMGTGFDPVYQTKLEGISEYRFDVADGLYELVLHFAELVPQEEIEVLPYNLDDSPVGSDSSHREFSVSVNDNLILSRINNQRELLPGKAFSTKTVLNTVNNEGISIRFTPHKGETLINGIQLRRLF